MQEIISFSRWSATTANQEIIGAAMQKLEVELTLSHDVFAQGGDSLQRAEAFQFQHRVDLPPF